MSIGIGTKLGPYEIVAPLGAGGMGEVYRAKDLTLDREVAIKILPDAFAHDAERVARFTREAKTLASLNHPNIAQIYGVIEEDQPAHVHALVMELVEGEDLSTIIARHAVSQDPAYISPQPPSPSGVGRVFRSGESAGIPLADALPIAKQIADALEAAHEQGVIHRDLKPANIKVRADGTVKVLDFGLAKALDANASGASSATADAMNSPTLTAQATQMGMIIGTAAYMAPEQARGKAVDKRADIWAFGVVLYEMLTGRRLFPGEEVSDTLAAVLRQDVDWQTLPASMPPPLAVLLRRCLERDPKQRLRDIGEARVAVDDARRETADGVGAKDPGGRSRAGARPSPRWRAPAAAGLAALALVAAGWMLRQHFAPADGAVRKVDFSIDALDVSVGSAPVIAPDGSRVAYLSGGRLYMRRLDSLDAVQLPAGDDVRYVTWSPDSRQLAYARRGRAWKVSSEGGAPTDLGPLPEDLVGSGGSTWTADGQVVFAGSDTSGLWAVPAAGGGGRAIAALDRSAEADYHEIASLPDGRGLMFTVHRKGRLPDLIAILAEGSRRALLEVPGDGLRHPMYSPTGHILYERETTNPGIWAVPFSLDRLETTGPPFPVAPGGLAPSLARDGTLCFVRVDDTPVQLVRVTRAGVAEPVAELAGSKAAMLMRSPMGAGTRQWAGVSLSPDGTRVAISLGFSPGQLAVYDLTRGALSSVASGVFPSRAVWVDHGDRLVYGSSRGSRAWNLWSRRADGGGEEERWSTSDEVQLPSALTPDGTTLLYSEGSGPQGTFRRMPAVAGGRATQLFANRVWGLAASVSPDGRYVAHESPESGRSEIYVQPYPQGDERFQVSTEGGESPVWTRSGEILYLSGASVMSVSVASRAGSLAFSKPVLLFGTGGDGGLAPVFDVAPDARSLYMLRARGRQRVALVFNWPRDLARVLDELNMAR